MMMKKRTVLSIVIGVVLLSGVTAAWALPPRVSFIPAELKPESIAPGASVNYTVTIKHTGGILSIPVPLAHQLRVVPKGNITPFVTVIHPTFPLVFKRGNTVNVNVLVNAPAGQAYLRKGGQLVLKRKLQNGSLLPVIGADKLPVEFTFSLVSLPPYPDQAENDSTLEGIDMNANGVRDDIDHYVVETYPDFAKIREALKQETKALQEFLVDYAANADNPAEQKRVTRENDLGVSMGSDCRYYLAGLNSDMSEKIGNALLIQFLNTKERSRAYDKADSLLGGTSDPRGPVRGSEWEAHHKAGCTFNPDALPNRLTQEET